MAEIDKEISELFRLTTDCSKRVFEMKSQGSCEPTKKCAMKMKEKQRALKNFIQAKDFIRRLAEPISTSFRILIL